MADSDRSWAPPFAGTEAEHLTGAPDRLQHPARVDDEVVTVKLTGGSIPAWDSAAWDGDHGLEFAWAEVDGRVGEDPPPGWHPGR
jgi:hypothetical protein